MLGDGAGGAYWGLQILNEETEPAALPDPLPLSALPDTPHGPYTVVMPVHTPEQLRTFGDACLPGLRRIADDVNRGIARVLFDRCNEGAYLQMLDQVRDAATLSGIAELESLAVLSQDRLLGSSGHPVRHLCFDIVPLLAWRVCRDLLIGERAHGLEPPWPNHAVLCPNATPREHRFITLLALAEARLIDASAPNFSTICQIPYVSFPGFESVKLPGGAPPDATSIVEWLQRTGLNHLAPYVAPLLERLPLRIDDHAAQGNELAAVIDLPPYRDSKISVVTETDFQPVTLRITEKTMKPMALGQPFVTIGCQHSIDVVRTLGYSAFEGVVDHSYDALPNPVDRLTGAVASAKDFVNRYDRDPAVRAAVRENRNLNIDWTLNGFARHYSSLCREPLLTVLRLDGPIE
jgi:hypothetical protein